MNFKPTKIKFIISLLVLLVNYYLMNGLECICTSGDIDICTTDYGNFSIFKTCCGGCVTLEDLIFEYFSLLLLPALIYIFMSQEGKKKII